MHNIHAGDVKMEEYTNASRGRMIHLCFMNKQYVPGVQIKKNYLKRIDNIAMWLYSSLVRLEITSLLFKK